MQMYENQLTKVGPVFSCKLYEKDKHKRKLVVCLCSCGQYCIVTEYSFGKDSKSCGCKRYKTKKFVDKRIFTEQEKENIIYLYINDKLSTAKIASMYNTYRRNISKILKQNNIKIIKSKYNDSNSHWKGYKDISLTYWNQIVSGASGRNLEFNITQEYIWNLLLKQNFCCNLTGLKLEFKTFKKQTASLDRIDSTKGYVEGNVQWIHKDINLMKNRLPQDYFINMCSLISNKYKQDNLVMIPS